MLDNLSAKTHRKANPQNIADAIRILFEPEQVVELRVPKSGKYGTISGYFSDHEKLAQELEALSGTVGAVYYTLNPVNPSLLARANNRTETYTRNTTNDAPDNIIKRRWLFVDCDPIRPSDISSTDEEKQAAKQQVTDIRACLTALGWPEPVVADSGNGYHLLYRIDLPNDDPTRTLLESALKALAARFDNSAVKIDQTVFNASRITKAYGTMACKGDSIPERPHRLSKMFKAPERIEIVSRHLLEALAADAPKFEKKKSVGNSSIKTRGGMTTELVESVLDKADVNHGDAMDYNGVQKWQHDCLNNSEHRKPDAFTILDEDGYAHHHCSHNSCSDLDDADWRKLWEDRTGEVYPWPGKRDRKNYRQFIPPEFEVWIDSSDADTPQQSMPEQTPGVHSGAGLPDSGEFTYKEQDTGNGERLVKKFGHLIRWISETSEWMVWGEKGWRKDNGGRLMRMTKSVLSDLMEEAYEGKEVDRLKLKHALISGSMPRRMAMIASAGYEHPAFTNINDWDSDGWLFNCENGVIDLQTQTFRGRTPSDLCMKQSPIIFDPDAKYPLWEAAMNKWTCGDQSLVDYLQVAWGVTLTSDTGLQALFFNQGDGENGKDTAFSVISFILGSYWQNVNFMTFAETKNHSEHRNDLASLAGAVRMVTSCESSDGHSLDEGVIKQVTGCSPVTCRQIHCKPFTYMPQYKMWFMSNYEPLIKGGDWGIWRRVKKIPWNYTIRPEEKDPNFTEKLKSEAPGILNWMLRGLKRYIELGCKLPTCEAVEDATAQYRKDMDIIGRFVGECLTIQSTATALGISIYTKYVGWCKENGTPALSSRRFYAEFKKRNAGKVTWRDVNKGIMFEGVGILFEGWYPSEEGL